MSLEKKRKLNNKSDVAGLKSYKISNYSMTHFPLFFFLFSFTTPNLLFFFFKKKKQKKTFVSWLYHSLLFLIFDILYLITIKCR
jgi:membrane-associated HD superfamily phosphohydrolase